MKPEKFHLTKLLEQELNKDEPTVLGWLKSIDKDILLKYTLDLPVAEKIAYNKAEKTASDEKEKKQKISEMVGEEFDICQQDLLLATLYLEGLRYGKREEIDLKAVALDPDLLKVIAEREPRVRVNLRIELERRELIDRKPHMEKMLENPSLSDEEKTRLKGFIKQLDEEAYSFTRDKDYLSLRIERALCEFILGAYDSPLSRDHVMDKMFEAIKQSKEAAKAK